MRQPADKIRKLVALAASGDTPETAAAAAAARRMIMTLDVEMLDTLAGQRKRLLEELREESRRLGSSRERATKAETGELVSHALMLLQHYERYDALISAVLLLRVEAGRHLTNEERQQLDGPVEDMLDQWTRASRERRREARQERRRRAKERAAG
jgi:hypothetical protein